MQWKTSVRGKWSKIFFVSALILLPFGVQLIYRSMTALPEEIVLAGGPPGGQFRVTTESLAREIEARLNLRVRIISTQGSVTNFALLQDGHADFGLYTSGTLEILRDLDPDSLRDAGIDPQSREVPSILFVANVYLQPAHYIVRRNAGIASPADLRGKQVSLGPLGSGTYAMSLVLLQHFGLDKKSVAAVYPNHDETPKGFETGGLDAAFIHLGPQSPLFPQLLRTDLCSLLSIPNVEALAAKYLGLSQYTIPRGLYVPSSPVSPAADIQTVAAHVQLLTRADTHVLLVEEVTKIVLSESFQKRQENRLRELFIGGAGFATEKPEFPIHRGALRLYNPDPRPLLDADFVEATEGIRSFVFSFVIAAFVGIRWMRLQRERGKAHKLEDCLRLLGDIERRAFSLAANETPEDSDHLEKLLEEVRTLKQSALLRCSVRELSEDHAVARFLDMSHRVSDEINTHLLRERIEQGFEELSAAVRQNRETRTGGTPPTNPAGG